MSGEASDVAGRLARLEQRLGEVEDQLAIMQLIASYGPAVDGMDGPTLTSLWTTEGCYDFGSEPLVGRANVAGLLDLDTHRAYVSAGCAHVLSPPRIEVDGPRAVAVNHSQVFVYDGGGWRADRTCANEWILVRTPEGWQVASRTNRLLDGSQAARELFTAATGRVRPDRPNEV